MVRFNNFGSSHLLRYSTPHLTRHWYEVTSCVGTGCSREQTIGLFQAIVSVVWVLSASVGLTIVGLPTEYSFYNVFVDQYSITL